MVSVAGPCFTGAFVIISSCSHALFRSQQRVKTQSPLHDWMLCQENATAAHMRINRACLLSTQSIDEVLNILEWGGDNASLCNSATEICFVLKVWCIFIQSSFCLQTAYRSLCHPSCEQEELLRGKNKVRLQAVRGLCGRLCVVLCNEGNSGCNCNIPGCLCV